MKKYIFLYILFIPLFIFCKKSSDESIYNYSVNSIEGTTIQMNSYQTKKILITTLPIVQNADGNKFLQQLDSIAQAYPTVQIIGVPAIEDGYQQSNQNSLKNWYRTYLRNSIKITTGIYVRKTSGAQQHPLMQWLTDMNKNEVFNNDITAVGFKYFVRPQSQIYALLVPQSTWSSNAVNQCLQNF